MEREDEIRVIAFDIWEQEGKPEGRHVDHWLRAEMIWGQRQAASRPVEIAENRVQSPAARLEELSASTPEPSKAQPKAAGPRKTTKKETKKPRR